MAVTLSAGGSFRWWRDTVQAASGSDLSYDQLTQLAASVPAGAEGLVFLPYLTGERTPHLDPFARGAFVGLTARHTAAHMARAVMEGVVFSLRDGLEIMRHWACRSARSGRPAAAGAARCGARCRRISTAQRWSRCGLKKVRHTARRCWRGGRGRF
jgi:glycerol kinase